MSGFRRPPSDVPENALELLGATKFRHSTAWTLAGRTRSLGFIAQRQPLVFRSIQMIQATLLVMPGLVPGIHETPGRVLHVVDGRDEPGDDDTVHRL